MTTDYSQVSDTAKRVEHLVEPRILEYLESIHPVLAGMPAETPFTIADYGAADGANSSRLFGNSIGYIRKVHPQRRIRLVYVDIADPAPFNRFWAQSHLAEMENIEAQYIRRSFYEPLGSAGSVHIGFSSTSLHWLDTKTISAGFFRHPACIQANQLSGYDRRKFVEKWKSDWRSFFRERSRELVGGGMLWLANLTSFGGDQWPASPGYNNLRDICRTLYDEGCISREELDNIFIPDYFATPEEMRNLVEEDAIRQHFSLKYMDTMTVPCAYFSRACGSLHDAGQRHRLAHSLARVVRAWSESSLRVGLSPGHAGLVDEIYKRLEDRFYEVPQGLPYQYCLMGLVKEV
ncbi:hypothetical protein J2741_000158 [Methanolinea mesophila]|uniref:hypothetical protein n=1 Tax=Methanolinea mesophila TaxID=547055 RepID=UPI001AE1C90D|nr:hypothetical protein [Methanolinea mesophila]MBP1927611.1 hypothetical protein [Methanolinea mesophila]